MKLDLFNGGLNIRIDPSLINPNEAVVCDNVDTSTGVLKSAKGLKITEIESENIPYFFNANNSWEDRVGALEYLEYQNKLYWTTSTKAQKYDGEVVYNLGIEQTTTAIVVALPGSGSNLTGTYEYKITYYNSEDGTESVCDLTSAEVYPSGESVNVTLTPSSDPQVTHQKIYRVGGTLLSFTLVAQVSASTLLYNDDIADVTLQGNDQYNRSLLGDPPPEGLRYLRQVYGIFIGVKDNYMYYTSSNNPNYWPAVNNIPFPEDLTGLAINNTNISVHSNYKTYSIEGTSGDTFFKTILSEDQGCSNNATIAGLKGQTVFISSDGACATTGGLVQVISKNKLGKQSLLTINAVVHDEVYYIQLTNYKILALDFRYEVNIKYFDFGTNYLVVGNDTLYGRKDGYLYELFAGDLVEYRYKTGKLSESSLNNLKTYNCLKAHAEGTHEVKFYIDDILRITLELDGLSTIYEKGIPQEYQQGSQIELELSGTGSINELYYSLEGMSNV